MSDLVALVQNLQIETEGPKPVRIIDDVSCEVRRGRVVALIGESGSGKTTIALSTLGYTKPGLRVAGGRVLIGGRDVVTMETAERIKLRGSEVAYVAQSAAAAFNPAIRVEDQIIESAVLHGRGAAQARARARDLYRAVRMPNPDAIGSRYPHQVSGGQLQRLMFVMALCTDPKLLVLDEPTTALDVTTQIEVLKVIKDVIRLHGVSALYISHNLGVVSQIADEIVVLQHGSVKEHGYTRQIVERPKHPYTQRLIAAIRPLPSEGALMPRRAPTSEAVVAQLLDVSAAYGRAGSPLVLRDVSLDIRRARTIGVIGESGSGKSTLARVLCGLLPPVSGSVVLGGKAIGGRVGQRSRDELRRIQFAPQMADTALNPQRRIRDILARPLRFYRRARKWQIPDRVSQILTQVELPASLALRYPTQLSGGQKQRISLARAISADPEVLICDEVTSALDTIVAASVVDLLKELQKASRTAILFISHDLSTVADLSDEIVVMYAGRVVEYGSTGQVLSGPNHPYTRLLMLSIPELGPGWLDRVGSKKEVMLAAEKGLSFDTPGCPFVARCTVAVPGTCDRIPPPVQHPGAGHSITCHLDSERLSALELIET